MEERTRVREREENGGMGREGKRRKLGGIAPWLLGGGDRGPCCYSFCAFVFSYYLRREGNVTV